MLDVLVLHTHSPWFVLMATHKQKVYGFSLKSTDSFNVTASLNNHELPLTHENTHTHIHKQHIPALCTFIWFHWHEGVGWHHLGAVVLWVLQIRVQVRTPTHSHCASESLPSLLNTDTTHTHTQAAVHASHRCSDGRSTEDTLCVGLAQQQPPSLPPICPCTT